MIEVLAPSILADRSFLERIRFEHDTTASNRIVLRGLVGTPEPEILHQAEIARKHVCAELVQPWISFLIKKDLRQGQITISFDHEADRGESSFGLAFVVGMLALALDVPVLGNQAYTGQLETEQSDTLAVGHEKGLSNWIHARQVRGLLPKSRGCAQGECPTLFFPFQREDPEIARAELENAMEPATKRCNLVALCDRLHVANLVNIALDTDELWRQAGDDPRGLGFALRLLDATAIGSHEGEFPRGIGQFMANLRKASAIPPTVEPMVQEKVEVWRKACPQERTTDLLKAIISADPQRQLDVGSVGEISGSLDTDISHWLEIQEIKSENLPAVFRILELCHQVSIDFVVYRSLFVSFISKILSVIELAAAYAHKSNTLQPVGYVLAMADCFVNTIEPIDANHLNGLIPVLNDVRRFVSGFKQIESEEREAMLHSLDSLLANIQVAQVVAQGRLPEAIPGLRVEFAITLDKDQSWHFPRINNLVARFFVGDSSLGEMPSPVLLFDSSSQCSHFSRRRDFALADDAMNRLPLAEMRLLKQAWNSGDSEIGFCVSEDQSAKIKWVRTLSPWPPAIDSQLFAACIATNRNKVEPRSIMDVGCGTGFLASACLKTWPSIERLVLIEPGLSSLRLAVANMKPQMHKDQHLEYQSLRFERIRDMKRVDLIVSAPPYLPYRPSVPHGIEMATNGTALLQALVARGAELANEVWLTFSVLAWPEFIQALLRRANAYSAVEILDRSFVPFRIHWLEPRTKEERGSDFLFGERVRYYENVLLRRGLIDLDSDKPEHQAANYLAEHNPARFISKQLNIIQDANMEKLLDKTLVQLREMDSRGYRFWQEVRFIRLVAAHNAR